MLKYIKKLLGAAKMKNGLIIINKETGISSQAVVNRVKRLLCVDKAGHTGTLDPMATGVLPVLVGRGVKVSEFLLTSDKHYRATLRLGIETDTEDITGEVISSSDKIPTENEVLEAINSMLGKSMQIPPMYSAIKIGGKKLCDLARDGKTVERESRPIEIFEITGKRIDEREYEIDVKCSKGTYIRTLCADIGKRLGCGATMTSLCRMSAAGYQISCARALSEIEAMEEGEREALIIPIDKIFPDKKEIVLPPFFSRLARCGVSLYQRKIGESLPEGEIVKLSDEKGFFALGQSTVADGEKMIKPIKQIII